MYYQDFNKLWAVNVDLSEGVAFGRREVIADFGYPASTLFDVDNSGRIVI